MLGLLIPQPAFRPVAALSAALVVLVFAGGCGSARTAATPAPRGNLESIFEDEALLHAQPATTLDVLRRLGVDRVRVYLAWESFAPDPSARARPPHFDGSDPSAYAAASWSSYDTIVRDAAARGIALDFTIGGPAPVWATGRDVPHPGPLYPVWKVSPRDYGAFVRAVATRYSGHYKPAGAPSALPRVSFWSIWNEPNYGTELAPQAIDHTKVEVSPRLYRGLLDAAWSALHSTGHAGDTILIGETAPRGQTVGNHPGNFDGMVPLRFVRALYCVDSSFQPLRGTAASERGCPTDSAASQQFPRLHPGLFQAGGFADHPYPQGGVPPNVPSPDEPDYADLPSLPNLERTLDKSLAAYGSSTQLPIYSTEFGYQTDPPETATGVHQTSPALAASYLNWSEYISWRDPRVRSYDQYQLVDPPSATFATGLEFKNGAPKATFDAYRMPLYLPVAPTQSGQAVEVWGAVRPAHYASLGTGRTQRVQIQFQSGSHGRFKTLQTVTITDPHGYFDTHVAFAHSGIVRLSWAYAHGPTIHSRSVAISVH